MKVFLRFSATVLVTLMMFAAFTVYAMSARMDLTSGCSLPLVCG